MDNGIPNHNEIEETAIKQLIIEMQKYYFVEYPESKKFKKLEGCIQSDGMSYFVPCEVYDKITQKESFVISEVSREDLEALGYDASNVDDSTMERLASKLGDDYCEQLFWTSLDVLADCMEIPKNGEQDEEVS